MSPWIECVANIHPLSPSLSPSTAPSAPPRAITVVTVKQGNGSVVSVTWEPPPSDTHNGVILDYKVAPPPDPTSSSLQTLTRCRYGNRHPRAPDRWFSTPSGPGTHILPWSLIHDPLSCNSNRAHLSLKKSVCVKHTHTLWVSSWPFWKINQTCVFTAAFKAHYSGNVNIEVNR